MAVPPFSVGLRPGVSPSPLFSLEKRSCDSECLRIMGYRRQSGFLFLLSHRRRPTLGEWSAEFLFLALRVLCGLHVDAANEAIASTLTHSGGRVSSEVHLSFMYATQVSPYGRLHVDAAAPAVASAADPSWLKSQPCCLFRTV